MQKENAKISRIMEDKKSCNSNMDKLIEKENFDVITQSNENIHFSQTVSLQSMGKEEDQDIDTEITKLEILINKLQAEIVEMTETSRKSTPLSHCTFISSSEGESCCKNEASHASSEIENKIEGLERDAGIPQISEHDSLLEEVKVFTDSLTNIINSSNITDEQKDVFNDFKWNISILLDDLKNVKQNNLEIIEEKEYKHSSLETDKPIDENISSVHSTNESVIEFTCNQTEINRCDIHSEYFGDVCPTDTDTTIIDTCVDKEMNSDIKVPEDSTGDISESIIEDVGENITSNVSIDLNSESLCNLPDKHLSEQINEVSIENVSLPDTNRNFTEIEPVEYLKESILKTSDICNSDKTGSSQPSQVISQSASSDISETKTLDITRENSIPKADSIFQCINRKIRKIVGIDSEKSISQDEVFEKQSSKDVLITFPRCRSEPKRNERTKCDDNKVIILTQDKLKTISCPINTNISNSETSHIEVAESSNEIGIISESGQSSDSAFVITPLPRGNSQIKDFIQVHLTTTDNIIQPIDTANQPQTINIDNVIDNPDITKKNLEKAPNMSAGASGNVIPKLFDSNIHTEVHQANIMKAEVESLQEQTEEENLQEQKEEELTGLEEEEDDEDEVDGDYEDEDDETYDVD